MNKHKAAMLTLKHIEIYKSYNGDGDGFVRCASDEEKAYKEVIDSFKYGLVPPQNINNTGAIQNFVFQGVNNTGNQDITVMGTYILKFIGRYDEKTKQVKPLIQK